MRISNWPKADNRWYLAVSCIKCKAPIMFALDKSEGGDSPQTTVAGKLLLTCTVEECRHQADYTGKSVIRCQKKQGGQRNPEE